MASSSTFQPLQPTHLHLLSFPSSAPNTFNFHLSFNFLSAKLAFNPRISPFLRVRAHVAPLEAKLLNEDTDQNASGVSSYGPRDKRFGESFQSSSHFDAAVEDNLEKRVVLKDRHAKTRLNPKSRTGTSDGKPRKDIKKLHGNGKGSINKERKLENKGHNNQVDVERVKHASDKRKADSSGLMLRIGLDMCSKRGNVMGAIRLYDLARKEGINLGQYHYAVLLYLCASAATGVMQPAKSGSGNRSLNHLGLSNEINSENKVGLDINGFPSEINDPVSFSDGPMTPYPQNLDDMVEFLKSDSEYAKKDVMGKKSSGIQVSLDVKKYALERGFQIYNNMLLEKVQMNEAIFTSVARIAMSLGDGDLAFDIVKKMKELGINPRLRSYGPALSVFCNNGDVEKAFMVEEHMLQHGVYPEEPELEALLRASVETGRSDRVYYLLHKLRTSVRQVSSSTADLIEEWFRSKVASRVGKRKLDRSLIKKAMENGGGGWHGLGWLGKGKWNVSHTSVDSDGLCRCCGEKLVTIDLDPAETDRFAVSVASIAKQREKSSNFERFQKWLDYYGPFEAVVDGANIGLYSQRKFKPSKVNAVVNALRQSLPSKKWPLIVLHNRRLTGDKMNEPVNQAVIQKWKNADALYATPTGSNDDWYWLYAAIKFKCLMITNDEMRDHLFQLLGNDFFPRWKERHQVRFSFSETGPEFHMPPPCSVVIQESEKGHWHVPIVSGMETQRERTWLCITRFHPLKRGLDSSVVDKAPELHLPHGKGSQKSLDSRKKRQVKLEPTGNSSRDGCKQAPQKTHQNLKDIPSSVFLSDCQSIIPQLEAAENYGSCKIDFQI